MRYLVEGSTADLAADEDIAEVSRNRYPEVAVEHHYRTRTDHQPADVWVCDAPSETHVNRWAQAIGIRIDRIARIDPAPWLG